MINASHWTPEIEAEAKAVLIDAVRKRKAPHLDLPRTIELLAFAIREIRRLREECDATLLHVEWPR